MSEPTEADLREAADFCDSLGHEDLCTDYLMDGALRRYSSFPSGCCRAEESQGLADLIARVREEGRKEKRNG